MSAAGDETDGAQKPRAEEGPGAASGGGRFELPPPVVRKLRVFAIDPGLTAQFETAITNETTLVVPWEDLEPGPIGESVRRHRR